MAKTKRKARAKIGRRRDGDRSTVSAVLRDRARDALDDAPISDEHRANLEKALNESAPGTESPRARDRWGRFVKNPNKSVDLLAVWIDLPMRQRAMVAAPVVVAIVFAILLVIL